MLPQRAELWFVLRHRAIGRPAQGTPSGCFAERVAMSASTIGGRPGHRHPWRGGDTQRPAMTVHRNVTVGEIVVAGRESRSHGMGIWSYMQLLHGRIVFHVTMHAIARHRRVSVRSCQVAEDIVEGPVLADDEEQ